MKKIYLSNQEKKIAGVCAGLGQYFDMDPVFFRILFIFFSFFGGAGVVLYLIMWLIIPRSPG